MSHFRFIHRAVSFAACMLLLVACKEGDVDVDFDGSFDEDVDESPSGDGDGDAMIDEGDAGDGGGELPQDAAMDSGGNLPDELETAIEAAEAFPAELAEATCAALLACYGDESLLSDVLGGRSCERLYTSRYQNGDLYFLPRSIEAGRVSFDADLLPLCLEDVRALGCGVRAARLPSSCELAWEGNVELLGECALHEDCVDDAFCSRQTADACSGECAVRRGRNDVCDHDDDGQCSDGLTCFEGTCQPLGGIGAACGTGFPGCEPGLYCSGSGDDASCAAIATLYFRALDEACDRNGMLCEPGLVCESTTGAMGVCKEPVVADAACRRADPNQCPMDQYCDAEVAGEMGVCRDRPSHDEPCLDRTQACADGHACVEDTCKVLRAIGESCSADLECITGACGAGGTCDAILACGAP